MTTLAERWIGNPPRRVQWVENDGRFGTWSPVRQEWILPLAKDNVVFVLEHGMNGFTTPEGRAWLAAERTRRQQTTTAQARV
jgi:hypothetical protein